MRLGEIPRASAKLQFQQKVPGGRRMDKAWREGFEAGRREVIKIIDEVLLERRIQINRLRSAETIAHLHTFVNLFEDKLKEKIAGTTEKSKGCGKEFKLGEITKNFICGQTSDENPHAVFCKKCSPLPENLQEKKQ